jgi:hypothetical protein
MGSNEGGPYLGRLGSGSTVTDSTGHYEVMVDYNWSGKITAAKYAYVFDPNMISYAAVIADQTGAYTGRLMTYAISGLIRNACSIPIKGVLVSANMGGGSAVTDGDGHYEVWVPYNWSGTVRPTKAYYTFTMSDIVYSGILSDQPNQDYQAVNIYDLDCNGSIGYGDIAVMCDNWLAESAGNSCDLNNDGNVNFGDYAAFANVWMTENGQ